MTVTIFVMLYILYKHLSYLFNAYKDFTHIRTYNENNMHYTNFNNI